MVTKRDIYAVIGAYGLGRILPPGSSRTAAKQTVRRLAVPAARAGLGLARAHPIGAAAALGYSAYELGLLDPGIEFAQEQVKRKKPMTQFNKAVKEGMKIVKGSTSYGKKGTFSNSKKAFAAVTKSVAKARKGGKLAAKGVLRKVQRKAKEILGKEVKRRKTLPKKKTPFGSIKGSFLDPDMYYLGKRKGPG
jgi:hypothetical protein